MRNRQRGVSLSALLMLLFILIILALLAFKVIPPYMEFYTAKGAIEAIVRDRAGASVPEIRKAFDARATIDDINSVKAADLEIAKQGNEIVISFAYRKEVPLFRNIGVYIDFAASTSAQ